MSAEIYLFYGQGGPFFSGGINTLSNKLKQMYPSIKVSTWNWNQWTGVYNTIMKLPASTKIGLIGYSLGANAITWVASQQNLAHRNIDLFIALDPTIWSIISPLGSNVKKAISFHNTNPVDLPIGHAQIVGPNIERHELFGFHLALDFTDEFQSTVIKEVGKLV